MPRMDVLVAVRSVDRLCVGNPRITQRLRDVGCFDGSTKSHNMKKILIIALSLFDQLAIGQADHSAILRTDPFMSGGYFIVDDEQRQALRATRISVDVFINEQQQDGRYAAQLNQTISIPATSWFGKVDHALIPRLPDTDFLSYALKAWDANGAIVEEFSRSQDGGSGLPEICRETCVAPAYAYAVVAYSDQAQTTISLVEATTGGSYYYFYVPDDGPNGWQWWIEHINPSSFGLSYDWSEYDGNVNQNYVLDINGIAPAGATDWQGYSLANSPPGFHAIRKDKGPWRGFVAYTDMLIGGAGEYCVSPGLLTDRYNADDLVQTQLIANGLDPLNCVAFLEAGGGQSWGDGSTGVCTEITVPTDGGSISTNNWVMTTVECDPVATPHYVKNAGLIVNQWTPTGNGRRILTVPFSGVLEASSVPIPPITLQPGLYEFILIYDDGSIYRHYQDFRNEVTLRDEYADFAQMNIFPVPVTGSAFTIGLELPSPADLELRIVNNMGVEYHAETLRIARDGAYEHEVRMDIPWPSGLYHCSMTYPDGSVDQMTITVH